MDTDSAKETINNRQNMSTQKTMVASRERPPRDSGFNVTSTSSSKLLLSSGADEKMKAIDIEMKTSPTKPVVQHKIKQGNLIVYYIYI